MATEVNEAPILPPLDELPPETKVKEEVPGEATASIEYVDYSQDGGLDGNHGITDSDVLFGRGGLTNRHIGNLRYRDMISLHREDYVNSSKAEKPNVARRIVRAIRSGNPPGRFLKRDSDGAWHEVSDKEAAWKASQALREKSRWSCMKENNGETKKKKEKAVKEVVGLPNLLKKRKLEEEMKKKEELKKAKTLATTEPGTNLSASDQIIVPTVEESVETKKRAAKKQSFNKKPKKHEPEPVMPVEENIVPRNEDVLFGRGGKTNHHPGNIRLREVVKQYQVSYQQAKKVDKPKISKLIVAALRKANPPSRFLRWSEELFQWIDVGDKRAAEKVSQTLREKERDNRRMPEVLMPPESAVVQHHEMTAAPPGLPSPPQPVEATPVKISDEPVPTAATSPTPHVPASPAKSEVTEAAAVIESAVNVTEEAAVSNEVASPKPGGHKQRAPKLVPKATELEPASPALEDLPDETTV